MNATVRGAVPERTLALRDATIGVIVTDGNFTKVQCRSLAEAGHDGLARAVIPAHTPFDGDAFAAVSCPNADDETNADIHIGRLLAEVAVQQAIGSIGTRM